VCLRVVTVRLLSSGTSRGADREALHAFVAEVTDTDPGLVRVDRRCPHCGATDHGRPEASAAGRPVAVGLARTPGVTVLAVGPEPIGVDVERPSRVAAAPLDVFADGERRRAGAEVAVPPPAGGSASSPAVDAVAAHLAACWAVKEAVLKRDGRGLRVDPLAVEAVLRPLDARWSTGEHDARWSTGEHGGPSDGNPVPSLGDHALFAGVVHPVRVLRPDEDLVLAVAAGGASVRVQDRRGPTGSGSPTRRS
jgi:hypothetical protein